MGRPAFGGMAPAAPYGVPAATVPGVEQQLEVLKGQAEYVEGALDSIRKRIEELESRNPKD